VPHSRSAPVATNDRHNFVHRASFTHHRFHQICLSMRRFLDQALRRKKVVPPQGPDGPPPPYVMTEPAHTQRQCTLFNVLSADVRLLIYEAVLSDSGRLLHVTFYNGNQKRKGMGHWRCSDEESPHPTWQHKCFGIWVTGNRGHRRKEPRSDSNLVSLLLACRIV
jgi:hypothetical protein